MTRQAQVEQGGPFQFQHEVLKWLGVGASPWYGDLSDGQKTVMDAAVKVFKAYEAEKEAQVRRLEEANKAANTLIGEGADEAQKIVAELTTALAQARDHIRQELAFERGEDWKECYCSNKGKCSVCFLDQALTGTTEKENK